MDKKYYPVITKNGRIAVFKIEDFDAAIAEGKALLIVCGGSAIIIGADAVADHYDVYTREVSEETFDGEVIRRFHKIIVTDGIRVLMKTGNYATHFADYSSSFVDCITTYNEFIDSPYYEGETEAEFEKYQYTVDVEKTKRFINGDRKEQEEIWESIKGMSCFFVNKENNHL